MAFDLTGVQSFIESLMDGTTVTITRADTRSEPELDDETGDMHHRADRTLYTGPGLLQPMGGGGGVADPDVQRIMQRTGASYRLLLPASTNVEFLVGDKTRATTSPDPLMLARRWTVAELAGVGSLTAARVLYLTQRDTTRTTVG